MKNLFFATSLLAAQLNASTVKHIQLNFDEPQMGCFTRCLARVGLDYRPQARLKNGTNLVASRITAGQLARLLEGNKNITAVTVHNVKSPMWLYVEVLKAYKQLEKYELYRGALWGVFPRFGAEASKTTEKSPPASDTKVDVPTDDYSAELNKNSPLHYWG